VYRLCPVPLTIRPSLARRQPLLHEPDAPYLWPSPLLPSSHTGSYPIGDPPVLLTPVFHFRRTNVQCFTLFFSHIFFSLVLDSHTPTGLLSLSRCLSLLRAFDSHFPLLSLSPHFFFSVGFSSFPPPSRPQASAFFCSEVFFFRAF